MHAAIVTGVSRGLGEALASAMLAQGFAVVGVGRTASTKLQGSLFRHAACDLSRPTLIAASVTPALRELVARKPASVTLINNAAVASPTGLVGQLDAAEIESALTTNTAAPLVMADLFCRSFSGRCGRAQDHQHLVGSGADRDRRQCGLRHVEGGAGNADPVDRGRAHREGLSCISLRPGIFETGMQAYMRSRDPAVFPSVGLFRGFKENGLLKDPVEVAARIVQRLVLGPVENGRTYTHADL